MGEAQWRMVTKSLKMIFIVGVGGVCIRWKGGL